MSKQLLVIEDNKSIASVIKHLGDSVGYQVTIAESFAKVKSLLAQEQNFFAATVDINLPDAPNGEVIPYVIEHGVPSIIMTGRMDEKMHRQVLNLPVIDYIIKENAQAYHYLLRILSGQLTNHKIGILLVDNSSTSRNQLSLLLKRRNFSVYCAANASEALTVLDQRRDIKMVITEQEMPIINGVQLVQKIRRKYAANELIVMGLTNGSHNFQAERFIKNGADDYLKKPFSSEEFYCRIMQNIERLSYIEEIEKLASTDELTALPNRRSFIDQTKLMLKRDYEHPPVQLLAILHIDKFKELNDKYGYKLGNKLLIEIANILKIQFSNDVTARLNGAEFAIFIKDNELEVMKLALTSLQQYISQHPIEFSKNKIDITISLGGKLVNGEKTLENLLKGADQALIQAKKQGGAQLVINEE
ncbi:GGDEF domain-containing response regulator [Psychromonas ossibalaenae]|uniref:GGDEF domain-containing response regulator n=1 Tax=Psychromonas ossibalaenae TaxID=444922 RepID=UPI00039B2870|nr:diguanylate cyclase [Psychromonas ossibalaenae]